MSRVFPNRIWIEHDICGRISFPNKVKMEESPKNCDSRIARSYILLAKLEKEGFIPSC